MDLPWYFIEIINVISLKFQLDFDWYFIEILLRFNWISNGFQIDISKKKLDFQRNPLPFH